MGIFGKSREEKERQRRYAEEKAAMERGVALAAEEDGKQLQAVVEIIKRIDGHSPRWNDVSRERTLTTLTFECADGLHGEICYTNSGNRDAMRIEIRQRDGGQDHHIHLQTVEGSYQVKTDFDRYKWETRKGYSYVWEKIRAVQESLKQAELERNKDVIEKARKEQEEANRQAELARQRFFQK